MQGTMPGARRRGRPRTAWTDNIKTWTGLSVKESIRMTEDRDKWGKYVHGVANSRIEDGQRTEQNSDKADPRLSVVVSRNICIDAEVCCGGLMELLTPSVQTDI